MGYSINDHTSSAASLPVMNCHFSSAASTSPQGMKHKLCKGKSNWRKKYDSPSLPQNNAQHSISNRFMESQTVLADCPQQKVRFRALRTPTWKTDLSSAAPRDPTPPLAANHDVSIPISLMKWSGNATEFASKTSKEMLCVDLQENYTKLPAT